VSERAEHWNAENRGDLVSTVRSVSDEEQAEIAAGLGEDGEAGPQMGDFLRAGPGDDHHLGGRAEHRLQGGRWSQPTTVHQDVKAWVREQHAGQPIGERPQRRAHLLRSGRRDDDAYAAWKRLHVVVKIH
jgi:hypothetical protein